MKKIVITFLLLLISAFAFAQAVPQPAQPVQLPRTPRAEQPPPGEMRMKHRGPDSPEPMLAPGRPRMGAWWKDSEMVKELQLTPQQISSIQQSVDAHRLKLVDLRADVERNETKMQILMESEKFDESAISTQLDQLLATRSALEKENAMMGLSIRRYLNPDQWKKLQEIQAEREHFQWTPRAPAMPGGPPQTPQPMRHPAPPPPPREELLL